jgi:hypothetical protein
MVPALHAATLKAWGKTLEWAWPHDGLNREKGSGLTLAEQYREHGLRMLPERATFEDGGNSLEVGLQMMLERMQTDRLKIFSNLDDLFTEISRLHRKDGRVRAVDDDCVSALRYALMMLRFAIDFPTPLRGTAATALNAKCSVAAAVLVNAQGFQAQ